MISGCKKDERGIQLFNTSREPAIRGAWVGDMNILDVGMTTLELNLDQTDLNVKGLYVSEHSATGEGGTVKGVTTGPTFQLTLTAENPDCPATIDINGQNNGDFLGYSFTGKDCNGVAIRGEGRLQHQP